MLGTPALRPGGLQLTAKGISLCRARAGARVLDIGCGSGETVEWLRDQAGLDARGVDASAARVRQGLARRPGLPLSHAHAEALPFADASFDGVVAECVLSQIDDLGRALAEVRRVLMPGGWFLITDLYARDGRDGVPADVPPDGGRLLGSRAAVADALGEHGLSLRYWEDCSGELATFVARAIMSCGSLEAYCVSTTDEDGCKPWAMSGKGVRDVGYCLCVAQAETCASPPVATAQGSETINWRTRRKG